MQVVVHDFAIWSSHIQLQYVKMCEINLLFWQYGSFSCVLESWDWGDYFKK